MRLAEFVLAAALAAATPVLFAAVGELLSERAGVLNLGLEGLMLVGAVTGFAVTVATGSAWTGVGAAFAAGAAMGVLFAALTVTLRADQIVTGLAFTILGTGMSAFIGQGLVGVPPRDTISRISLGPLADIPLLGPALFRQTPLTYLVLGLALAVGIYLRRSRGGLLLRVLGEKPDALDTLGISVVGLRYLYVAVGSALAAVGGAALSVSLTPAWVQNMTVGRGWIAIALVVFSLWRPGRLVAGAVLFGTIDALRFRLPLAGVELNSYLLAMLPYALTLAALAVISRSAVRRRIGVPAALGVPYDRERR
jgi:general nucleoside transport system permease protein